MIPCFAQIAHGTSGDPPDMEIDVHKTEDVTILGNTFGGCT